jgi:hypothetical protein
LSILIFRAVQTIGKVKAIHRDGQYAGWFWQNWIGIKPGSDNLNRAECMEDWDSFSLTENPGTHNGQQIYTGGTRCVNHLKGTGKQEEELCGVATRMKALSLAASSI